MKDLGISNITTNIKRKAHWENIFQSVDYTQVLWHQKSPRESLSLIQKYSSLDSNILDVGCGASFLVDNLLHEGYKNITLLDTSKTSLDIVKNRISSDCISYVCNDVLNFKTDEKFDIWHDRAVFHFLLTKKEREIYFQNLEHCLSDNAIAIISTFATHGEHKCAGLDIIQYDKEKMLQELPCGLKLVESNEFLHHTPKESTQKYISFVIQKYKQHNKQI